MSSCKPSCKLNLTFFSPAKVNLFFKVLSRREDGYHDIFSLNQAISLFDILKFTISKRDNFFCLNNKNLKFDDSNLIIKALRLFKEKTKIKTSIEISLKKNIPISAGLGGGSSNGATTLFALNELFQKPLTISKLIELSKNLGADAPFFFSKGTCFCENIGDKFEDITLKKNLKFYIAKPIFGMSTIDVYKNVNLNLLKKVDVNSIKKTLKKSDNLQFFNDLEISAFDLNPKLKTIQKDLIKMGFDKVVMTGSGSSFMCFGNITPISSEKITFFEVFNVQRKSAFWYSV